MSCKAKVAVVGPSFHFLSGISAYTCRLTNELSTQCDTSVLLLRRVIPRRLYPTAHRSRTADTTLRYRDNVTVLGELDWYWFPGILSALGHLRAEKPDILLLQWWTAATLHTYIILALAARMIGIRVALEFHETQDTGESSLFLARTYCRRLMPLLLALVGGALIHSRYDLQLLRRTYGAAAIDRLEVELAPHGPYDHIASPAAETLPTVHDASPTRLLYFGLIRPYKGLEDLVLAFNHLSADQAAQFHLTIVGETWEHWDTPAELVSASPHRRHITFVNRYVSDTEAAEFFRGADALVLPYRRGSASGPLHIAMHAGLHVVLYAVGGLIEATQSYEGAHLVASNDVEALRTALMSLPPHRTQRFTDHTSWSSTVHSVERLARPPATSGVSP